MWHEGNESKHTRWLDYYYRLNESWSHATTVVLHKRTAETDFFPLLACLELLFLASMLEALVTVFKFQTPV